MFQAGKASALLPTESARPLSRATQFFDTGVGDDEEGSESGSDFESDSASSASGTTISVSNDAETPVSPQLNNYHVPIRRSQSVQGPCGPHLFRTSFDSAKDVPFEHALQLSPIASKEVLLHFDGVVQPPTPTAHTPRPFINLELSTAHPEVDHVRSWTSEQVASWMSSTGSERSIVEKFRMHEITGAVVLDLQFEDLKELDIPSFGKRHQIWNALGPLRADGGVSPACTEFKDVSVSCSTNTRSPNLRERSGPRRRHEDLPAALSNSRRKHVRRKWSTPDDGITPAQSVSIVAIEQLIPKPHRCSKGENCPKWKKQQRLLDQLDIEHGLSISPTNGGTIFIAGDPGNAEYAENIVPNVARPSSEAVTSVVASSDLLGPGQRPNFALREERLRDVEQRDPQENVRQFLRFQHMQSPTNPSPFPSAESPEYDMFPPMPLPIPPSNSILALRQLPKLEIPRSASAIVRTASSPSNNAFSPRSTLQRFGTPASELDVPLMAVPATPVPRNASQSVPPNMQFRVPKHQRAWSRDANSWRRQSFALPTLPERTAQSESGQLVLASQHNKAHGIYGEGTTQAGWMRKRKTKLLRHEWNEAHFRLKGTQLAMHASALATDDKPLDTIDVEQYAIACSSLASNSKLAAALKSLRITSGKSDTRLDEAAFAFQLIPAAERARRVGLLVEGAKTHHFAVKSREERIDWMRDVMLAKALRQKGDGYEVVINGQMA